MAGFDSYRGRSVSQKFIPFCLCVDVIAFFYGEKGHTVLCTRPAMSEPTKL